MVVERREEKRMEKGGEREREKESASELGKLYYGVPISLLGVTIEKEEVRGEGKKVKRKKR